MDTIFLSYTYNPHPEYLDETKELVEYEQHIGQIFDKKEG